MSKETPQTPREYWNQNQVDQLTNAIANCNLGSGKKYWNEIADKVEGKTANQCQNKWYKVKPKTQEGNISTSEPPASTSLPQTQASTSSPGEGTSAERADTNEEEMMLFFKSLISDVLKLTDDQRRQFKVEVMTMLNVKLSPKKK